MRRRVVTTKVLTPARALWVRARVTRVPKVTASSCVKNRAAQCKRIQEIDC